MKRFLLSAVIAAATLTVPALAADVGVSVSIGQPGFYGQINIGDFPQPRVLYPQPIIIERGIPMRSPVYLRVPPGHAKHWSKHCHEYHACGERVLFVNDDWYEHEYVPRYQEKHRDRGGYDRQDKGRGDDHGNKGRGNDHGNKGHGRD